MSSAAPVLTEPAGAAGLPLPFQSAPDVLAPAAPVAVVPRPGCRIPAAVVRGGMPVLARLAAEGRGTAEALVEESRRKDSPFHGIFRWGDEDQELAREYRLVIGRRVWASVEVRFTGERGATEAARAFTAVRVSGAFRYVATPEVARSPGLQEQALRRALADLEALRRKHSVLRQLFSRSEIVDLFERAFFGE